VIVVADSSPLIVLSKLQCFNLLHRLYSHLYISSEVHHEVVSAGSSMPGAGEVHAAEWIEVKSVRNRSFLLSAQQRFSLGLGELSSIALAKELKADLILLDDHRARRLAEIEGLRLRGSLGLLEMFHTRGYIADLRSVFQRLLTSNFYIDRALLNRRLHLLGLPPL
jgi:uncharacterized protein